MIQKSAESSFCGWFWKGVKNASAFEFKRKYVLSETQVRLG